MKLWNNSSFLLFMCLNTGFLCTFIKWLKHIEKYRNSGVTCGGIYRLSVCDIVLPLPKKNQIQWNQKTQIHLNNLKIINFSRTKWPLHFGGRIVCIIHIQKSYTYFEELQCYWWKMKIALFKIYPTSPYLGQKERIWSDLIFCRFGLDEW